MDLVFCPFCFQPFNGYGLCPHCGHAAGESRGGVQQLPLGTILDGKYQLGMVLGQGGFGITYLAYDLKLQTRVAIKEYFPLGLVTRQAQTVTFTAPNVQPFFQKGVEAFYREAQLLTRFRNHPNIVHVSSFFRQNGTAYFVMEYVEGESLTAYLEKRGGRLPYDETIRLLTPVLDALQDVHSAGILHRDIAPDNICLAKDGNVKLLDFGAAKNELSMHTHSSAAILKPGFAPLEQYSAGSNQGPWTDIYAIGAVIYKCLTGSVPPDAPDRIIGQALISFHDTGVDAPAGSEMAIAKALALDIHDRWQSVPEFKTSLIDPSALKNKEIQTTRQKKGKNQKKTSAKKWLIPFLAVLAIFIIAAGITTKTVLIPERKYRDGVTLIETGQYEAGIKVLQDIRTYKDSESQIRKGRSLQAEALLTAEEYEQAQELFAELSGAEYAEQRIAAEKYAKGLEIISETTAEPKTEVTPEPTSVTQQIPGRTELQKRLSEAEPGDIITFGQYEQDGNEFNGKEPIEWIVLEKQVDRMLLVSRFILDRIYYHNIENVTWEKCDIRKWLNNDFYNSAFHYDEKSVILESEIITPDIELDTLYQGEGYQYLFKDGSIVIDRCFLLSYEEIKHYFDNYSNRIAVETPAATKDGFSFVHKYWYVRSATLYPGGQFVPVIDETGTIRVLSLAHKVGVRPAIWVSID